MSFELRVETEGYIRVDLHGELTQADIDAALEEILVVRSEHKVENILCDQRDLQVPPSEFIVFETARRFSLGPYTGMKLAIVRASIPEHHLFETVARNRSGAVRIFDDEEKARRWFGNDQVKYAGRDST